MRRRLVLFGGLLLTVLLFYGLGKVFSVSEKEGEPFAVVMPARWVELERKADPEAPLLVRPLSGGLLEVVRADPKKLNQTPEQIFARARVHEPDEWFLHPEKLKGTPLVAAERVVDAGDPQAVAELMKRVQLLAVSGQVPMDGAWKYSGGAWQKVELPRPLQEAIDDTAYAREALLMPKEHAIERDHSGEHTVVALTAEGDLTPPAERVRFKVGCEGGWDDVMQKVPGALVRENGTVLEWYRLKRFPTPEECAAL
jgi:hypothetical protein